MQIMQFQPILTLSGRFAAERWCMDSACGIHYCVCCGDFIIGRNYNDQPINTERWCRNKDHHWKTFQKLVYHYFEETINEEEEEATNDENFIALCKYIICEDTKPIYPCRLTVFVGNLLFATPHFYGFLTDISMVPHYHQFDNDNDYDDYDDYDLDLDLWWEENEGILGNNELGNNELLGNNGLGNNGLGYDILNVNTEDVINSDDVINSEDDGDLATTMYDAEEVNMGVYDSDDDGDSVATQLDNNISYQKSEYMMGITMGGRTSWLPIWPEIRAVDDPMRIYPNSNNSNNNTLIY